MRTRGMLRASPPSARAAAVARTGTLWGAVGLHWGWNVSNGLVDLFVDVNPTHAWARSVTSVVTALVLLAAVWLLPRARVQSEPGAPA